jgi:ligand-binding SRPBCC domain-containing protein
MENIEGRRQEQEAGQKGQMAGAGGRRVLDYESQVWNQDGFTSLPPTAPASYSCLLLLPSVSCIIMSLIELKTVIHAPAHVCFDLARNIDVHVLAPSLLKHKAVGGVTTGLINLGEHVSWEGKFLGIRQRMTSKIVTLDSPRTFTDEMQHGPFKRWRHTHRFEPCEEGTIVFDRVEFASPFGPLGAMFDALILKRFMTVFLVAHNKYIKEVAEAAHADRSFTNTTAATTNATSSF